MKKNFNDSAVEAKIFNFRNNFSFVFVVIGLIVLLVRMAWLQVFQYDIHATRSQENRVHIEAIPPTRGLILDSKNRILAKNIPIFSLFITPEIAKPRGVVIKRLCFILQEVENCEAEFIKTFKKRRNAFEPLLLMDKLNEKQIANISVNKRLLPGVEVQARLLRYYPYKEELVHLLGYVGRINEKELETLDRQNYNGTNYIGKIGIENFYEKELHGEVGYRQIEVNANGKVLNVIKEQKPVPGRNLKLHLDLDLQQAAIRALGDQKGAVVAIDPKTGGILAFASTPGYDPNKFVLGIDSKSYKALLEDPKKPLINRAANGIYPPASTVKPFMGMAALDLGVTTPTKYIIDKGYYIVPDDKYQRKYRNWKKWGQGKVDLYRAIVTSNDTYFYDLAYRMGIDNIYEYMTRFGFGKNETLDVYGASSGLMPSREWKKRRYKTAWFNGETVNIGIGQGYWLTTPLQLATATGILANRGTLPKPRLLNDIEITSGLDIEADISQVLDAGIENPDYWDLVIRAMNGVLTDKKEGTARYSTGRGLFYSMAGKTGTAQVYSLKKDEEYDAETVEAHKRDHALFISFAPIKDPKIVMAVVVENGGGGSSVAGPISRKILDYYMLPKKSK